MLPTILLLSIKPEYAKQIFETQTKTIELRRVRTRLKEGDIVVVYVSSPEKVFVGSFDVERIIEIKASCQELKKFWDEYKDNLGISRQEFYSYYQGASIVVGILIKKIKPFEKPVKFERLSKKLSDLRPPQSYRYLNKNEYEIIKALGTN
ncbi:ASCH domain protein [Lyngbya aestuarii BL J]|uniref:ASCH domain protein n=2 Tax=Lyngbya aestuarii BL J TaxID=1348334 RepID=U7QMV1_9CYAN|nr:ASCH domain protein [Lyngbya aestuarii]ERT08400.1 ASCH domain protein [Lyngbya aestuarii BL J]